MRLQLVACGLIFCVAACHGPDPTESKGLRVVATIPALAFLVAEIGGDQVDVSTLLPTGASPHTYEPTVGDAVRAGRARLFVSVGGGFDDWTTGLAPRGRQADHLRLFSLDGIAPIHGGHDHDHGDGHGHDGDDPHIWLDPIRVRDVVVPAIAETLSLLDAANADFYRARARAFAARLTDLDKDIAERLQGGHTGGYVAFHNAWRYFADRYGLNEVGVVEEYAGEEPTPREIAALIRKARAQGTNAILVEPQLGRRMAAVIAAEFGGATVLVDPVGDAAIPGRSTYNALMRFNADAFARALEDKRT